MRALSETLAIVSNTEGFALLRARDLRDFAKERATFLLYTAMRRVLVGEMGIPKNISDRADELISDVLALSRKESIETVMGLAVILLNWGAYKLRLEDAAQLAEEFELAADRFEALAAKDGITVRKKVH